MSESTTSTDTTSLSTTLTSDSTSTTTTSTTSSDTGTSTTTTSTSSDTGSQTTTGSSTSLTSDTTTTSTSTTSTSSSTTTTSAAPPTTSTSVVTTTGSGGNVVTLTSVVTSTPSRTLGATPTATSKTGFFQNTAAVAATFSVVGLIVVAIIIFAITQTIRRRRAKDFDREIAEAAREAATAPVPVFLDDEDDHYGPGYGQAPAAYSTSPSGGYSDVSSHGTYGQPPMNHEGYAMSERSAPGPGQFFDHNMYAAAGAAGIGVARARSTRDGGGYAAALNEGNSPYPAFANSHPQYDMYNGPNVAMAQQQPMYRGPGSNEGHDGMGMAQQQQPMYRGPGSNEGHDGMGLVAAGAVPPQYTGHSSGSDLSRMKSNGSRSLVEGYYPSTTAATAVEHPNESYASYYQPGFDPASHQPYDHPHNLQPGLSRNGSQKTDENDAAYGGYADYPAGGQRSPTPGLPNPFAADKGDVESEEDSGEDGGRRVLKVANT